MTFANREFLSKLLFFHTFIDDVKGNAKAIAISSRRQPHKDRGSCWFVRSVDGFPCCNGTGRSNSIGKNGTVKFGKEEAT